MADWQAGQVLGINAISGAAALPDGSVVLAGSTDGNFAGTGSHAGGKDFAVIKLTADGETEWTWQVTSCDVKKPEDLRMYAARAAANSLRCISK